MGPYLLSLLREQEDQMDQLCMATAGVQSGSNVQDLVVSRNVAPPGGGPKNQLVMDNDDASTIDQDISSLADDNDVGEVQVIASLASISHSATFGLSL